MVSKTVYGARDQEILYYGQSFFYHIVSMVVKIELEVRMAVKIVRVLNTNAVVSSDQEGRELIITGAGIGFRTLTIFTAILTSNSILTTIDTI